MSARALLLAYGAAAAETDPEFANVSLLLHCDGADTSQTFADNSSYGHTVTAAGNAQISTTSPKFGSGAALFDGAGDYLTVAHATAFTFPGDFTWEFFFKSTSTVRGAIIAAAEDPRSSANYVIQFNQGAANDFHMSTGSGSDTLITFSDSAITDGAWHHMAITREGTAVRVYRDGAHRANNASASTFGTAAGVWLGNWVILPALDDWSGRLDEIRLTKGVARYTGTSGFTPPAAPYPNS